jgi:hypothetical protein
MPTLEVPFIYNNLLIFLISQCTIVDYSTPAQNDYNDTGGDYDGAGGTWDDGGGWDSGGGGFDSGGFDGGGGDF